MARIINKNQYRKIYPRVRKRPEYATLGADGVDVEAAILTFDNTDFVVYTFKRDYSKYGLHPAVCVTTAGLNNDLNLFISHITTESVTIRASAKFTGTAHLVAVERLP